MAAAAAAAVTCALRSDGSCQLMFVSTHVCSATAARCAASITFRFYQSSPAPIATAATPAFTAVLTVIVIVYMCCTTAALPTRPYAGRDRVYVLCYSCAALSVERCYLNHSLLSLEPQQNCADSHCSNNTTRSQHQAFVCAQHAASSQRIQQS